MTDAARKTALRERLERIEERFREPGRAAIGRLRSIHGCAAASVNFSLGLAATYDRTIEDAIDHLRTLERGAQDAIADLEQLQADLDEGRVTPAREDAA